ncbi:class I SAM-dependent methyltransferase [Novispirillum sp. DQ9]|uniref:class I SAM-dependent methyltransferase n=1 Tax=Novispirillum sp. DQ9 TaxID=3398612 RepID=UPI003C7A233C
MSKVDDEAFLKYHTVDSAEKVFREKLSEWKSGSRGNVPFRLVDIGGGDGQKVLEFLGSSSADFAVHTVDIEPSIDDSMRVCLDITLPVQGDFSEYFDVVYSFNAFEHFKDPLMAADNCVKMLRPGGLCLVHTVFSWRYHPVPDDYFRFTDSALRYLFSERNGLTTLECGYDLSMRRMDIRGGYFGDRDIPPIDDFGGFRENWGVFYVGTKDGSGDIEANGM